MKNWSNLTLRLSTGSESGCLHYSSELLKSFSKLVRFRQWGRLASGFLSYCTACNQFQSFLSVECRLERRTGENHIARWSRGRDLRGWSSGRRFANAWRMCGENRIAAGVCVPPTRSPQRLRGAINAVYAVLTGTLFGSTNAGLGEPPTRKLIEIQLTWLRR